MSGSLLERQATLYTEAVEAWKKDHDAARVCLFLEDVISLGLHIYEQCNQRDRLNRRRVFTGKMSLEHMAQWEAVFATVLRMYLHGADQLVAEIGACRRKGTRSLEPMNSSPASGKPRV